MPRRSLDPRLLAGLLALLTACGGGDTGTNPLPDNNTGGGGGGGGGTVRTVIDDPSFSTNIQEIFTRRGCTSSGCHGAGPQASLDLRSSVAYSELVNVTSTQEPDFRRVVPGDAQNSYLVIKIENRQNVGTVMPQTGGVLDTIDIRNIRNWISQGAKNN